MTHESEKDQGGGEYAIPEPPDPGVTTLRDREGDHWGRASEDGTLWSAGGISWDWGDLLVEWGPLTAVAPPEPEPEQGQ